MKFSIDDIAVLGRARHLNYGEMAIKISHMNETELSLLYKEAKRLNPSKAKSKSKHCSTSKYFFKRDIVMYDCDGNILATYKSIGEAAETTGTAPRQIEKHINGEIQYPFKTFNRSFRWADKPMTVARKQIHRPNAKAVELYDKTGKILGRWQSIRDAAEATGRHRDTISKQVQGVTKNPFLRGETAAFRYAEQGR